MTLQNKKLGLLNDDDTSADVPDLFDQYGSDDTDDTFTIPQQTTIPSDHDVTRPKLDDTKEWEQEYEEETVEETSQVAPEAVTTSNTVQEPATSLKPAQQQTVQRPKRDDESVQEPKLDKETAQKDITKATVQTAPQKESSKKSLVRPELDKQLREIHIDPSKKTILIVDDDIDTLEMYADVFENANYNVIRAADGLEALSLMGKHTPHVIFTGIVMPRMDGFAMMESLNQNKRTADIPVVINSHLGRDTDKGRAEELGARDFIVRGFTQPREVLERIGALLLKSEYVFEFDAHGKDVKQLVKDLGNPNFLHCPRGQKMAMKLKIEDERTLAFSARFSCVDVPEDKK